MGEKKLLALLRQKRGFFETILDLTEEEATLPVLDWIAHLEQKHILLNCIDELDRDIHRYRATFVDLSQDISDELESIRVVVGHILHIDHTNLEKRKQQFDGHL